MIQQKTEKVYLYVCNYCKWDTAAAGIKGKTIPTVLQKLTFYRGKYLKSPQSEVYKKLMEVYKWQLDELQA